MTFSYLSSQIIASTLFLVLSLSGCNRYGSKTSKTDTHELATPRATNASQCAQNKAGGSDLVFRLDETLSKTKESKSWPVSNSDHCKRKTPYHFTVVSVSPTIVIGSPAKSSRTSHCSSNNAAINCLRSKKFMGYYEVDNKFTHTPGLVWFSPEHGPRLFDVPAHANSIFLMIGGQSARLKRKGDQWVFIRKH